ncbi:integrase core domain-containing protein [Hirsutella rhossiliensis]|uniref:Integrase core domain-containing protein n=1 Tax=Hirsutella rhossiliensis TaxID=111463 RepID=A0A9P8SI80_9HYPO|nr:integrase core domain-containing protein [Hirsutella rhossiliensis]KAH0961746.1 integrase core domain-containing protein [Hirsutella rhossiliensis]
MPKKLPTPLGHLAGFFSKKESNQLPPLRGPGRDMKIYLTKPLPERSRGVYRNPHHLDELLRKTIQDYLDKGFIESCWPGFASPAFFVPKGDMGMDWRFVIDYRDLNDASAKMKYPMPLSYADDILIYSESAEENVRQTEEVIRRLAAAGLQGDIKKSSFCVTEVDYLGLNDNSWKPVAYFSKTLSSTETVWPIQDREFLAIIRALEEWRPELILSEFDYKMTYRPGKENIIADALSRKSENFETVRARDLDSRTMELVPNDRVPAEVLEETHVEAAPLDIAANSEDRGPALSKLILTIPGKKTDTAERLAKRYYRRVFGHLGLPKIWLSDNGPQFISKFMAKVNEMTGTEHKFGSAYHAQTQGGVEITNQYLDQRLTFYVSYFQDDWSEHLAALDFAHNSTPHDSTGMTRSRPPKGEHPTRLSFI